MTDLVVRRLLVDLETPFARRWCGGDAFRSAFFNALSMSFPAGEQFFIDAVRAGIAKLPAEKRAALDDEVRGFIGQEATHRRIHNLYNGQLAEQGLLNTWEARIVARQKRLQGADPRHAVGVTAATEHLTAIFAEHFLLHPQVIAGADPRLATLWQWHSAEENEHRSTAFEVYRALGGNEAWRRRWLRVVTLLFVIDLTRQTLSNLKRDDGALWRWSTWQGAGRFLFGREHGLLRFAVAPWRAYQRADFHPRQQGGVLGQDWLNANPQAWAAVGGASRLT